ncbi:hypothetical protein B0T20DRAFT_362160, partial [Sordaria brevicollis]
IDFINGFSVFRNSYRILIGFYFTFANLSIEKRLQLRSIFLFILKPYSLRFDNIIKALKIIIKFNENIIIFIFSKGEVLLYIFPIYYIRDIL